MSRPCICNNVPPTGESYTTQYCRLCWLYHNSDKYRILWDGNSSVHHESKVGNDEDENPAYKLSPGIAVLNELRRLEQEQNRKQLEALRDTRRPGVQFNNFCKHLKDQTGETIECPTCSGKVTLKLFGCDIHTKCLPTKYVEGTAYCPACTDREPITPDDKPVDPRVSPPNHAAMMKAGDRRLTSQITPKSPLQRSRHSTNHSLPTDRLSVIQAEARDIRNNVSSTSRPISEMRTIKWAYGVTATPKRKNDLLPRTLSSLADAGFPSPRLFVDGILNSEATEWEDRFNLLVTPRYPKVRTFTNWVLALAELYLREPTARRYAIFQDDIVCCLNLRQYLDLIQYPDGRDGKPRGYLNLYTFPQNEELAAVENRESNDSKGESSKVEPKKMVGFYPSDQKGKGAQALVFNRECVQDLLTQTHMIMRVQDVTRGHKAIDGGIVTALAKVGWIEYVHYPSLVQHTGMQSSMGNMPQPLAPSFRGEDYDALQLVVRPEQTLNK